MRKEAGSDEIIGPPPPAGWAGSGGSHADGVRRLRVDPGEGGDVTVDRFDCGGSRD
jgi:hypothetical protein